LTTRYKNQEKAMPILIDDLKTLALVSALRTSALYIALLIVMLVVLAFLVINQRRKKLIGIGDGGDKVAARMIRVHGNFCENAPFAMALLILLPMLGGSSFLIHGVGGFFLLGRMAHAYGLSQAAGSSVGRVGGMVMTLTSLLIGAGFLLKVSLGF
jgi:uncharacterized protein